ncbi:MAG TPA: AmmeMemoRadiSam system protein A [Terriglobales bacterium]|jgi:AmmeMemoRadiSam system protein A|nr:AmmeMemoRadiSam system protein A [Terriglobales bacterium]
MFRPSDIKSDRGRSVTFPELSPDDRQTLLRIAHESILSSFTDRAVPKSPPSAILSEPRGVFTTLYLHGSLRGCVGYAMPVSPLYLAVAETARAAAFEDTRFQPVDRPQAQHLKVSLSVLSAISAIQPEDVEVGRHGLVVSLGGRRGLLLPQVPTEHGWDRETFLQQTCRKAGLPADAWRKGASFEAFTAEVFGDDRT